MVMLCSSAVSFIWQLQSGGFSGASEPDVRVLGRRGGHCASQQVRDQGLPSQSAGLPVQVQRHLQQR